MSRKIDALHSWIENASSRVQGARRSCFRFFADISSYHSGRWPDEPTFKWIMADQRVCIHYISSGPGNNECVNRDQPLIHFYHKAFLRHHDDGEMEKPPAYVNEAELTHEGQIAEVNGVKIRFHRWVTSEWFPCRGSHTKWNGQNHSSSRYVRSLFECGCCLWMLAR